MKEIYLPPPKEYNPSAVDLAHQAIAIYGWHEVQRAKGCGCNGCVQNAHDLTDWIFERADWKQEPLRIKHKVVYSSHSDDEPPLEEEIA